MALLTVDNLRISFNTREGKTVAVENLSFSLDMGQVLGIVGESGSGKSVACYSLVGLVPSPPGQIEAGTAVFQGRDLLAMNEKVLRSVRGRKIGMIFQDPMTSLNPYMRISDQLVEALRQHIQVNKKEARERAIEALREVGIQDASERIDSYPHEFSGGMRQRVMIAMAIIHKPDLLIADEPTTALDVTVQAQILALIKKLQREHNLAVIFISHDLAVVAEMADTIVVMHQGRVVESGDAKKTFNQPQHDYTRKLLNAIPASAKPYPKQYADHDPHFLQVQNLHTEFVTQKGVFKKRIVNRIKAVDDISLSLKRGEILGLVGESGSGKSSLGRSIMRLVQPQSGRVVLDGVELLGLGRTALRVARRDFQMVFQDPYASLNPRMTVFDTLAEPLIVHKLVKQSEVLEKVNQLMDDVGLDRSTIRKYPHEFSGGQRQRIAIARALAMAPKLIIADEPVSALDVTIQAQILELLMHLTQKHQLAMLFISHDLSVVRYIADRVAVMQNGKIVETGETEALFAEPKHAYTQALLSAILHLQER